MEVTTLPDDAMRISAPGAYLMSAAAYYGDPCPTPSLTQSIAKVLLDQSPAHARLSHPRLNPNYEPYSNRAMERGTAAHALLIGRGKDLVVIEAPNYQTKAAKQARDDALSVGRSPVLADDYETASAMVEAARRQLGMIDGCEAAFDRGHGELVLAWREEDLWLRTQIDWTDPQDRVIWDYKTTQTSAAPHRLATSVPDKGLDIQAGTYERGLCTLWPEAYGRWSYRFVLQEVEPPFALSVVELPEGALTMGRKKLSMAIDMWRRCTEAKFWPAYPLAIVRPGFPAWAEMQWLAREVAYADIAGSPLDPFHAVMGAATPARNTGMLTEIVA